MTGHGILCADEDDPAWSGRLDDDFITRAQASFPQSAHRNRGLVLDADSGPAPSPNLYFRHLK